MIVAKRVTYQNFMSAGNAPITLDLNKHKTTLVIGRNGAGKSTWTDAICFGWFGQPLRNVNKPTVVNAINGRDCLVTVDFDTPQGSFTVKRGIKPSVFEIYRNGVLEPIPADLKDYQQHLEENILKLNYKTFLQVVVLGSASYTPFMQLTTAARRGIIEDLLDIQIFSTMSAIVKDDLSTLKAALDTATVTKRLLTEQLNLANKLQAKMSDDHQAQLLHVQDALDSVTADLRDLKTNWTDLNTKYTTLAPVLERQAFFIDSLQQSKDAQARVKAQHTHTQSLHASLSNQTFCPTCEQPLDEVRKQSKLAELTTSLNGLVADLGSIETSIQSDTDALQQLDSDLKNLARLKEQLATIRSQVPLLQQRMKDLQAQKTKIQEAIDDDTAAPDSAEIEDKLATVNAEYTNLANDKVVRDAAVMLLKDNGIKTRVVAHYLPIINQYINQYLNALDLPIQFTFDSEFKEVMKSRYRDAFAYNNFSEGEKRRIDIALLFTWRAVARLKNSANINLLILDEVFDSALDTAGMDEFLKILNQLEEDTRIYVISHRTDQMSERFPHQWTFEKLKGFSTVK